MSTTITQRAERLDVRDGELPAPSPVVPGRVMTHDELVSWLNETDPERLAELWRAADEVRAATVGDEVHLRGLIEISNHCVRQCGYCGLRAGNRSLARYRMTDEKIVGCAHDAREYGYGTVVLQAGEDYGLRTEWISDVVRRIKAETGLAVTLSLGERGEDEFLAWREAGADRYLLRFETSDERLYRAIHPTFRGRRSDRPALLRSLRDMGYEIGSGVMVGIPGQTYDSLACDIELFRKLDLDMIGIGPYIAHPETPLGKAALDETAPCGDTPSEAPAPGAKDTTAADQAPNSELMVYKMLALTRLSCPQANLPSTTALATINKASGRELGLQRGANIVMPNLTPRRYRAMYEIYPAKACIDETAAECRFCLLGRIESIGRRAGTGPGGRRG